MQFSDEREKFGQQNECVVRIRKPGRRIELTKNAKLGLSEQQCHLE